MLSVYLDEVVPKQANPVKGSRRIDRLTAWWGAKMLSEVSAITCREYVASRKRGGARRDLEDLRSAINHHAKRGFHSGYVQVELPEQGKKRTTWLTRSEAARLLWACWRHGRTVRLPRGRNKGAVVESDWHDLRHIARFILLALYTGSRAGAIFTASIQAGSNRSFIDLDSGIFYRLAEGKEETNKRQPPVPLPDRLLAHIRRWRDRGVIASHVVEWHGEPVQSVKVGWASAVRLAGLNHKRVTPHTLRHTAATWLMINGTNIWDAENFLGMSEQMVRERFGHHHPEYMRDAANRITQKHKRQR